jgi:hypothetical protein
MAEKLSNFWSFLDGKKTWIGAIVASAPQLIEVVSKIITDGGGNATTFAKVAGLVVFILGAAHKLQKEMK